MADFNGTILTTAGLNLLSQAQSGETLQFTQVVLGSGTWSSTMNPSSMTSLVYPSQTVPIQSVSVVGDGTARLRFLISNSSLSLGYLLSEIGIYAQTTSSPNTLYAVTYAQNPDFIPAAGVTTIEDVIDIYTVVSNAQSVTAVIDNSVLLATIQDVNTARPEFSSSTPTDLYPGKIWVSDTQPAEFYDGTQWQPFNAGLLDGYSVGSATGQIPLNNGTLNITLNADMVDGFHASATPTPNMLLPLNSNTQFPASVIPPVNASSVGGYTVSATPAPNVLLPLNSNAQFPASVFPPGVGNGYANPINLTSATADYLLQPGQVAVISFSSQTLIPLHIAVPEPSSPTTPVIYEFTLSVATGSGANGAFWLYPNNTSYGSSISVAMVEMSSTNTVAFWSTSTGSFVLDIQMGISDTPPITLKATACYWGYSYPKQLVGMGGDNGGLAIGNSIWNDTSTHWSSLGSFGCLVGSGYTPVGPVTGTIIVRRIS